MADRNKGQVSSLGYMKLIETYLERDCKETGQRERMCRFLIYPLRHLAA